MDLYDVFKVAEVHGGCSKADEKGQSVFRIVAAAARDPARLSA